MGQVVWAWANATEVALKKMFDGSDESIQTLTTLISNGKMISGSSTSDAPDMNADIQASVVRTFYSYTIPAIWTVAAFGAFVMDSGYSCDHTDPLTPRYLDTNTAHATYTCYNNKLYYLVRTPDRPAHDCDYATCDDLTCLPGPPNCYDQTFETPPGLENLGTAQYGHVTVRDLIIG
jgi:hypothetical protein